MGAGVATNPHCLKVPSPGLGRAGSSLSGSGLSKFPPSNPVRIIRRGRPGEEPCFRRPAEVASSLNSDGPEAGFPGLHPRSGCRPSKLPSKRSFPFPAPSEVSSCWPSGGTRPGFPNLVPFGPFRGVASASRPCFRKPRQSCPWASASAEPVRGRPRPVPFGASAGVASGEPPCSVAVSGCPDIGSGWSRPWGMSPDRHLILQCLCREAPALPGFGKKSLRIRLRACGPSLLP